MENIYVLNYLINRQIGKKNGRMVVLFVDLKAVFDSMDRGLLIKEMRKREVREGLVRRCEEILRETINKIRRRKGRDFGRRGQLDKDVP